jgi:hypothetical protein
MLYCLFEGEWSFSRHYSRGALIPWTIRGHANRFRFEKFMQLHLLLGVLGILLNITGTAIIINFVINTTNDHFASAHHIIGFILLASEVMLALFGTFALCIELSEIFARRDGKTLLSLALHSLVYM